MKCACLTPEQAEHALPLYRALVGQAPLGGVDAVLAVLAHAGSRIWCAFEGASPVSMATLHVLPNVSQGARPYALIENVATLKAQRGRGYGRAVMEACVQDAWDDDAYKIMLMTGKTATAKGFYETLGFTADEKWAMTLRRAPLRTSEP